MSRKKDDFAAMPIAVKHFDELPNSAAIDVRAVALLLGCGPATVYRWVRSGRLPSPTLIGPNCSRFNVGLLRQAMKAMNGLEFPHHATESRSTEGTAVAA